MTSKERVVAALNHRQPDRVPMDFGGTAVTGLHVTCVAALRDHINREENGLFPASAIALSGSEWDEVERTTPPSAVHRA